MCEEKLKVFNTFLIDFNEMSDLQLDLRIQLKWVKVWI